MFVIKVRSRLLRVQSVTQAFILAVWLKALLWGVFCPDIPGVLRLLNQLKATATGEGDQPSEGHCPLPTALLWAAQSTAPAVTVSSLTSRSWGQDSPTGHLLPVPVTHGPASVPHSTSLAPPIVHSVFTVLFFILFVCLFLNLCL